MSAQPLPLSALELCEAVRLARPIDHARLNRVLRVEGSAVEAQAGVGWETLAALLTRSGSKRSSPYAPGATLGETIACNAAGPDGRPAVAHVDSLALVTPDGQLRRVSRLSNRQLFALAVGGYRLFGVLYSVTLRLDSLAAAVADAPPTEVLHAAAAAAPAAVRSLRLLVPPEQAGAFLDDARRCCDEWRIGLVSLEARHIRAEKETYLRWAPRDYTEVTLGLIAPPALGASVRMKQLATQLIDAAISRGGAFPIACTPQATRAQTLACYPQLGDFLGEQRRIDPQQKMVNGWARHQRRVLAPPACAVRWEH